MKIKREYMTQRLMVRVHYDSFKENCYIILLVHFLVVKFTVETFMSQNMFLIPSVLSHRMI